MPRKELPQLERPRGTMVDEAPTSAATLDAATRQSIDQALLAHPHHERPHLLPILQAVQAKTHWLSRPTLGYLSEQLGIPFSDLYGFATFYALLSTTPRSPITIRVCKGVPCCLGGAVDLGGRLAAMLEQQNEHNAPGQMPPVDWEWYPCLGQCEFAPAILVGEEAVRRVTPAMLEHIVTEAHRGRL